MEDRTVATGSAFGGAKSDVVRIWPIGPLFCPDTRRRQLTTRSHSVRLDLTWAQRGTDRPPIACAVDMLTS